MELSVITPMPDDVIENESVVLLTLFAREPEEYLTGFTIVAVEIPPEEYIGRN